ncbi:MAG: hypothetical protein Q8L41_01165 [Anaerolineales bacterium]|nr:hypothetical protein [Anaerolineales bacterium]
MTPTKKALLPELFIILCCLATAGLILIDTISRRAVKPQNFNLLARHFIRKGILPNIELVLIVIVLIVLFILLSKYKPNQKDRFLLYSRLAGVFLGIWLIYLSSSYFVSLVWKTPKKTVYFPQLAGAFLEGKTYLTDPSSVTDLTSYQGELYVAFPPLPSLLMLPQIAMQDVDSVNTVQFTIFFGALNAALAFAILELLARHSLTSLNRAGNLWLTVLFAFGSVHWYMSLVGHIWYLSQIVTVTFAALAVFLLLETRSLVLASLALAIGMLARPTIVLMWPLLYALYFELNALTSQDYLRRSIKPVLFSALPIGLAISGLLWYNFIRFDSPFDFGYQTMNVGDYLKPALAAYGQFNFHFVMDNLTTMFFALPRWNPSCGFPAPDGNGMSILITTPALIFLYKARGKSLWVWSAWFSVLLLLLPLLLYFNNGSFQFGFRFLMDLIVPLLCLLAFGAGQRLSFGMRLLILVGVLVNYYGLLWFFIRLCKLS